MKLGTKLGAKLGTKLVTKLGTKLGAKFKEEEVGGRSVGTRSRDEVRDEV